MTKGDIEELNIYFIILRWSILNRTKKRFEYDLKEEKLFVEEEIIGKEIN